MSANDLILGTSVTWADFETNLREALGTQAKFGPAKSVTEFGDGKGMASCCGLIFCDWVGVDGDSNLPTTVVIKIPSVARMRRMNDALPEGRKMFNFDDAKWAMMEAQINEIHNTEVAAYAFLDGFEGRLMPRMFYGRSVADGGQLCISYAPNTRTMEFYERHTLEQLRQVARALGKIQACSLMRESTSPELSKDTFKMMAQIWSLETFRGMFKGLLAVDSSEKTAELMEKIDALLAVYHGSNLPTTIHKQMGLRPVLVNGDLHVGNVLIDRDSGDLAALVDWQGAHLGVGVEDLHRIAVSALPTEERRAGMPELVSEMYDAMVQNLDGTEPPYTLETLLLVSDLVFPQCALALTAPFVARITRSEKDASLSDEEKAAIKEVMLDKLLGTLADVVAIDAKNKNKMGDLKLVYE